MALDTLSNVKLGLGILEAAEDANLTRLMAAADDFIADFCDRTFEAATCIETHPARGRFVFLRNWPVETLDELYVDAGRAFPASSLRPSADWVLHADRGVVESVGGAFLDGECPGAIRAVYETTGEIRADLRRAYARLVGFYLRRQKTEVGAEFRNVAQQRRGDSFVIYSSASDAVPADVLRVLERYRCPVTQ